MVGGRSWRFKLEKKNETMDSKSFWIVAHIAGFEDADQRPTKVGKSDKARLAESLGEKSGENSG